MLGERGGGGIPLPSRPQPLLAPLDVFTLPHLSLLYLDIFSKNFDSYLSAHCYIFCILF